MHYYVNNGGWNKNPGDVCDIELYLSNRTVCNIAMKSCCLSLHLKVIQLCRVQVVHAHDEILFVEKDHEIKLHLQTLVEMLYSEDDALDDSGQKIKCDRKIKYVLKSIL